MENQPHLTLFFVVYATTLVQVHGLTLYSGTNFHRTRYYTRACFDHFYVYVIAQHFKMVFFPTLWKVINPKRLCFFFKHLTFLHRSHQKKLLNFIGTFAERKLENLLKLPTIVHILVVREQTRVEGIETNAKITVIESLKHVLLAVAFRSMASGVYRITFPARTMVSYLNT